VLPWILLIALRLIKRDHPRGEEPRTIDEVGKGLGDTVLESGASSTWKSPTWFWKS
jgi:hypothetical protein